MAEQHYNHTDIHRYLQRQMTPHEISRFETEMPYVPFLAVAL